MLFLPTAFWLALCCAMFILRTRETDIHSLFQDTYGNSDVPENLTNMNAGQPPVAEEECLKIISASSNSSITSGNLSQYLSPMSVFNPYFGYPTISIPGSSAPLLKNGRRRKRDLARTLIQLWLVKLKRLTDKTWPWILVTIVLWGVGLMDNYK